MLTLNQTTNNLNRYKMVSDTSRYSGPEPQMLPFPAEIIARILSYLDEVCDKRNARLACKGFAAAGLCSLTSTAYFSTSSIKVGYHSKHPLCSSPTREMAMHPVVSKYITRMVCDGTQLLNSCIEPSAFHIWWTTATSDQRFWPTLKIRSVYSSRNRQEDWIISRGEDQKIFRTALEQFVNLKCIVFTDSAANERSRALPRPTWPSTVPEGDL